MFVAVFVGAGTETIRRIVYFGGLGIGIHLAVTVGWAVIGAGVAIPASRFHYHRALAIDTRLRAAAESSQSRRNRIRHAPDVPGRRLR